MFINTSAQKRTNFVITADGTVYSADVAARVGLCLRDADKPGNIFIGEVSAPAKLWIEAGSLDQEAVDIILAMEGARQPQRGPAAVTHTAAPVQPKAPASSPAEQQFVDALGTFLTSDMGTEAREQFIRAFREASKSATAKGR